MIGPLLHMELLTGSRRGKLILLRRVYSGWLILQFILFYSTSALAEGLSHAQTGEVGRFINDYLDTLVRQHFFLMVLVTPAFVAGAIADEKARGTLQFLLTAQLSDWEIIAGKYVGRLAQVAFLALTPLPLLALVGGLGELAPLTILALAAVSIAPLLALGALSILSSVWSLHTRDAVLRVYVWLGVGWVLVLVARNYLLDPVLSPWAGKGGASATPAWVGQANEALYSLSPLHVLDAAWGDDINPRLLVSRLLWSMLGWGSIAVISVALAVWRLRPAYTRQLAASGRKRRLARLIDAREPLDGRPIAWKERVIEGIAPLPSLRSFPRWSGMIVACAVGTGLAALVYDSREPYSVLIVAGMNVAFVASLLVGVRSSGAICGERERQTWDSVLLTPLRTETIILEKHRGILQATHLYLAAYAVPMLVGALLHELGGMLLAAMLVALTWIGMHFMAAVGLLCSSRSQNSWRSLLATVAMGYGYGLAILFSTTIMGGCIISILFALFLSPLISASPRPGWAGEILPVAAGLLYLGLQALVFLRVSRSLLESAILNVVRRDRAYGTHAQARLEELHHLGEPVASR
jgi:ABC-type transport system involved in multi-copper enzyme maturation permease subunit